MNIGRGTKRARAAAGAAAVVIAALLLYMAVRGPGGTHQAGAAGTAGAPGTASATAGSAAAADGHATPAAAQAGAHAHADPLGPAAVALVAGRTGTVLAAVYDIKTGQTWRLPRQARTRMPIRWDRLR
jgi:hypothetical protein